MTDIILNSILALVALAVLLSMWRFHSNPRFKCFNLLDLITSHDGKISRPAVMEFGAFMLTGWGFVMLINRNNLSEWYMMGFLGAFVARAAHSAWLSCRTNGGENGNGKAEAKS